MAKYNEKGLFTATLMYEISLTAKFIRANVLQFFEKSGFELSLSEFGALDTLTIHPDLCQRDLAKIILKDRASTGRILNSLEQKGVVIRHIDTKNNRLVRKMELTDKGKKIHKEIIKILIPQLELMCEGLDPTFVCETKQILGDIRNRVAKVIKMHI